MWTSESKSTTRHATLYVIFENDSCAFNADNPIKGKVIISSKVAIPAYCI